MLAVSEHSKRILEFKTTLPKRVQIAGRNMEKSYYVLIAHPQDERVLASKRKNEFYLPHVSDKDLETDREIIGQIQKVLELNFELRFVGSGCLVIEETFGFQKLKLLKF